MIFSGLKVKEIQHYLFCINHIGLDFSTQWTIRDKIHKSLDVTDENCVQTNLCSAGHMNTLSLFCISCRSVITRGITQQSSSHSRPTLSCCGEHGAHTSLGSASRAHLNRLCAGEHMRWRACGCGEEGVDVALMSRSSWSICPGSVQPHHTERGFQVGLRFSNPTVKREHVCGSWAHLGHHVDYVYKHGSVVTAR